MKKLFILALTLIATVSFAQIERSEIDVAVVVHGNAADPFWSVFKNGLDQAAADLGVNVTYNAPDTFDMPRMAQIMEAAIAREPEALIVSIPDAVALGDVIASAVDAGIPVFSANSGSDVFRELGVLRHIGQTEYEAGLGGGQYMKRLGATKGLCINHEVGNVALDLRCQGFADGLEGDVEVVAVTPDPIEIMSAVSAKLRPDIDAIMAIGPVGGEPTLQALQEAGLAGEVFLGNFDLSPTLLQAAVDGEISFLIDQQQYLQGYLSVMTAVNYVQYGLLPGNEVILTGPGFVTPANAAQVISLSAQGIR